MQVWIVSFRSQDLGYFECRPLGQFGFETSLGRQGGPPLQLCSLQCRRRLRLIECQKDLVLFDPLAFLDDDALDDAARMMSDLFSARFARQNSGCGYAFVEGCKGCPEKKADDPHKNDGPPSFYFLFHVFESDYFSSDGFG